MNLDPEKVLVLFVVALLVLGPNRLPQAARTLGKGLAEVRKYTSTFQAEVNQVLAEPRAMVESAVREADIRSAIAPLRPPLDGGLSSLPGSDGPGDTTGWPEPGLGQALSSTAVPDDPGLN